MKLHLPLFLRKSLLSCIALVAGCTLSSGSLAFADDLVLGAGDELSIDYAAADSIPNLENGSLQLTGDAFLRLTGAGNGDGKTYTLFSGIGSLLGSNGSTLVLDDTNNAISNYFDITKPGSGFWADATLQLVDGTLQLVRHNETVRDAVTITTRQTDDVESHYLSYQYYEGVSFADIEYTTNSDEDFAWGGAIYGDWYSTITLSDNGSVTFSGNTASSDSESAYGGAICGDLYSTITLSDNGSVTFSGNTASSSPSSAWGGAIYGTITLSDNGSVTFSGNTASSNSDDASGGAIYGTVTMEGNGDISFSGNTANARSYYARGGAISGTVTLTGNGDITFIGNTASSNSDEDDASGGAINGTVTMEGNGDISFSGNTASSNSYYGARDYARGGAINGTVTMEGNGDISFSGNTASSNSNYARGGAIYGDSNSTITLSDNGSVKFTGNTATGSSSAYGGAIYGYSKSTITLSDNGSVEFSGNTASSDSYYARGGAIYGDSNSTITLSDNGSVEFSGNTAISGSSSAYGGAIYGDSNSTITLSDNGSVEFSGNTAISGSSSAYGGAIYTVGNLRIRNNESVLFEQNAEISNGAYRLRSIHAGGSGDVISLSAAAGKSIEFRDAVYIRSDSTVNLNADYGDIKQKGDILFTGKYTETHLNELLASAEAGRTATAEEILNSRTTEVNALTNLYGGRLRVEDGAIYQGQGITAHEGSGATVRVKDAELSHAEYNLQFNAGTALEVAGNSTIRGNVNLKEGSLFKLEQAAALSLHETLGADAATLTVSGGALLEGGSTLNASLTLADGATLDMDALDVGAVTLNGALTFGGLVTMGDKLLGILSEMSGWEESVTLFTGLTDLVLPAVAADDAADRLWVGDVFSNLAGNENYYFNYVPEVGSLAVVHVPEPTTTTLSLLALAALAARRRRK